jgi:SMODS and SLOG-associating 2TM effector domain 3
MAELSKQAEAAIGTDDPGSDWQLAPEAHAAKLPPEAGALRRILESADVENCIKQFEIADKQAIAAQRRYKRVGSLRLYSGVAATIIGAMFILPLETWTSGAISIPAALQYGCLATSIFAALHLARAQPFDAWMKARARAEIARIALFTHVMDGVDPSPQQGELPALPLKLEYFRRYHLDVQRRFYAGRGAQHARAAGHTRRWQLASFGLTGLAGAVAMLAAIKIVINFGVPVPDWVRAANEVVQLYLPLWTNKGVLAIGVIASTLFGASVSRSLMNLDERNASRYLTTAANLDHLRATGLEPARAHAAAGATEHVLEFVNQVQELVSAEHQEWILWSEVMPRGLKRAALVQVR